MTADYRRQPTPLTQRNIPWMMEATTPEEIQQNMMVLPQLLLAAQEQITTNTTNITTLQGQVGGPGTFPAAYINVHGSGSVSANSSSTSVFGSADTAEAGFTYTAAPDKVIINTTGLYLVTLNATFTPSSTSAAWGPGPGIDNGQGFIKTFLNGGGAFTSDAVYCPLIVLLNPNLGAPPGTLQAGYSAGTVNRQFLYNATATDYFTLQVGTAISTTLAMGYVGNFSMLRIL